MRVSHACTRKRILPNATAALPLGIHSLAWRSQVSPNLDDPDLLAIPIKRPVVVSELQRRLCWKKFHDLMQIKHRVFANEVETVLNINDDIGRMRAETSGEVIYQCIFTKTMVHEPKML